MSDLFNENGLQVKTNTEIVSDLTTGYQNIYGSDIAVDQNSADGQAINLQAQGGTDVRELLLQVYNSFDPDNASGRVLDERCAINNVFRKGGTFSTVNVEITTDRVITLQGLDEKYNDLTAVGYTIQDDAGNQFILVNTITLQAGKTSVLFRASTLGAIDIAPNSLTTPVTVVLGVTSVNNPQGTLTVGEEEETDAELKIRRRQSIAVGSYGYLNGLLANILQLQGVTDAALYENYTNETDRLGIPPHCIWLVVEGGAASDIGNAIYSRKSYGCDMRGDITYTITTISHQQFIAKWDTPVSKPVYMKFKLQSLKTGIQFDTDAIKQYILDNSTFKIGAYAETASLTNTAQEAIQINGGNGLALEVLISSDNQNWVEFVTAAANEKLILNSVDITVVDLGA